MKLKNITKLGVAGFALIGLLLANNLAFAADTFKVGVLIPESGPAALFGPSSRNFAELAKQDINNKNGILGQKIELVFGDVGGAPADAVKVANRMLLRDKVDAFVGMHDSAVRAALLQAFNGKVPYIYTPVYEGGACSAGLVVLGETPLQQVKPSVEWFAKKQNAKKWYLIGNDYNWPRNTNKAAKEYIAANGGEVVGEEYFPFTTDNFDASLNKIKASKPDVVLITLVGGASVVFNRAFASFGLDKDIDRLGTLIEENTLLGIGAENSNNLYAVAGYFGDISGKNATKLLQRYTKEFGGDAAPVNNLGESVYEGLIVLQGIVNKAKSKDANKFTKAATGFKYSGPRGDAVFLADKHASRTIYLAKAQGATFKVIERFNRVSPGKNCS